MRGIWNRPEAVTLLLDKGANLEEKDAKGDTALIFAAIQEETNCVRLLLDRKADPNATDSKGQTALTLAGEKGDFDIVDLLKNAGARRTNVHIIAKEAPTVTADINGVRPSAPCSLTSALWSMRYCIMERSPPAAAPPSAQ